jgi:hypothetical protein
VTDWERTVNWLGLAALRWAVSVIRHDPHLYLGRRLPRYLLDALPVYSHLWPVSTL